MCFDVQIFSPLALRVSIMILNFDNAALFYTFKSGNENKTPLTSFVAFRKRNCFVHHSCRMYQVVVYILEEKTSEGF